MQQPAGNPDGRDSEAPTVQFPAPDFSAAAAERRDTDPVAASAGPDGRPGRSGDRERDGRREQDPDREHSADREQGPDREHGADREQGPDREHGADREQGPDREHGADREQGPDREDSADREQSADRERDEQRDRPPPAEWDPLAHGGAAGWRTVLGVLLVLGGVLGAMLLVLAMLRAPTPPPQPAAAQAPPSAAGAPPAPTATAPPSPAPAAAAPLPPSTPVRIDVTRARIHAPIIATGLDADDTVAVPPIDHPYLTGWYDRSVTPGQTGAAVLLGHVDSHRTGPAVFYYLGTLTRGDTIEVTRADHRVAVFTVDGVAGYPKTEFPATAVYGPTTGPSLRLVTCGGAFDEHSDSYERNVVVFASLSSSHRETGAEAARPLVTGPPR